MSPIIFPILLCGDRPNMTLFRGDGRQERSALESRRGSSYIYIYIYVYGRPTGLIYQ